MSPSVLAVFPMAIDWKLEIDEEEKKRGGKNEIYLFIFLNAPEARGVNLQLLTCIGHSQWYNKNVHKTRLL